jgi:hypothetical protein
VPALTLVFAATLVANWHSDVRGGFSKVRCPPFEDAASQWTRIAERLQNDVPARFLLGACGRHAAFDAELSIDGMSREEFQMAAAVVLRAVATAPDCHADQVIAMVLEDFPLPEGIEVPKTASPPTYSGSVVLEDARRLVQGLSAKLRSEEN